MNRVIPFLKFRFLAFAISALIIIGGISYTLLTTGFNLGMDFRGGFSAQVRIAPVGLKITNATIDKELSVEIAKEYVKYTVFGEVPNVHYFAQTDTLKTLAEYLEATGILKIEPGQNMNLALSLLFPEKNEHLKPGDTLSLQLPASSMGGPFVKLETLRQRLKDSFGEGVNLQQIGEPEKQQFLIRLSEKELPRIHEGQLDSEAVARNLLTTLEKEYGVGTVIIQSKESLSAQAAQTFATGSIIAIIAALGCMLLYVSLRFRFNYATAAVLALVHDVLATISFVGIFQVEVNTAVVAAVLTIVGYSINDTIVIYDRIRENERLLKGQDLRFIMDTSLSQTFARTIITSLTVFMAIFPLYLLGSGPVKDFSVTMIFGVIIGTYSSIFVASPIVLMWERAFTSTRQKKELRLYGKIQTQPVNEGGEVTLNSEGKTKAVLEVSNPSAQAAGTGPIVRVQRVVEKKKKKKR